METVEHTTAYIAYSLRYLSRYQKSLDSSQHRRDETVSKIGKHNTAQFRASNRLEELQNSSSAERKDVDKTRREVESEKEKVQIYREMVRQ